ncbi:MAG: response regulator [Cyanobacteria bacterium J06600_6]
MTLHTEYDSGQLINLIESLSSQKYTGILNLETNIANARKQRACNFVLRNGQVLFAHAQISTNEQFCKILGDKINPSAIDAALLVTKQRVTNTESFQEFVDMSIKMKVFVWEDLEKFVYQSIIQKLEIFSAYPGKVQYQPFNSFDLFQKQIPKNIAWSNLKHTIELREQQWQRFKPTIPRMDAIPLIDREQLQKVSDRKVQQHLDNTVDGQRNLLDIAQRMDRDPLKVAKTYFTWCKNGWVSFGNISATNRKLPIVLSVDDSPIIQTMISRALGGVCEVHLADQATTAMEMLNSLPVKMLLLDLTMPDIDGLDFCQKIRKIPKFSDLPIVMVTARDGLVNRAKGRFAGTNRYLTKPFKPEELRQIVHQYIG